MSYRKEMIRHAKKSDDKNILESVTTDNNHTRSSEIRKEKDKILSKCGAIKDEIDSNSTPLQQPEKCNNTTENWLKVAHSTSNETGPITDTDRRNTSSHNNHYERYEDKENCTEEQSETKVTGEAVTDLDKRYSCLFEKFTPDELDSLVVKNKHGEEILFCDLGKA